jgi:hypothetical protein
MLDALLHIYIMSPIRDVRVKYFQVLENLNGKLLDTVNSFADI